MKSKLHLSFRMVFIQSARLNMSIPIPAAMRGHVYKNFWFLNIFRPLYIKFDEKDEKFVKGSRWHKFFIAVIFFFAVVVELDTMRSVLSKSEMLTYIDIIFILQFPCMVVTTAYYAMVPTKFSMPFVQITEAMQSLDVLFGKRYRESNVFWVHFINLMFGQIILFAFGCIYLEWQLPHLKSLLIYGVLMPFPESLINYLLIYAYLLADRVKTLNGAIIRFVKTGSKKIRCPLCANRKMCNRNSLCGKHQLKQVYEQIVGESRLGWRGGKDGARKYIIIWYVSTMLGMIMNICYRVETLNAFIISPMALLLTLASPAVLVTFINTTILYKNVDYMAQISTTYIILMAMKTYIGGVAYDTLTNEIETVGQHVHKLYLKHFNHSNEEDKITIFAISVHVLQIKPEFKLVKLFRMGCRQFFLVSYSCVSFATLIIQSL